jgi:hypothetical protein
MSEKLKAKIAGMLAKGHDDFERQLDDDSNAATALYEIFYWQEICSVAKDKLKKAWASAQGHDGLIDTDDDLRGLGKGEHIACESNDFSALITVQDPRLNFDKELFKENVSKACKVPMKKLEAQEALSKVTTKCPLEKRVVEVA